MKKSHLVLLNFYILIFSCQSNQEIKGKMTQIDQNHIKLELENKCKKDVYFSFKGLQEMDLGSTNNLIIKVAKIEDTLMAPKIIAFNNLNKAYIKNGFEAVTFNSDMEKDEFIKNSFFFIESNKKRIAIYEVENFKKGKKYKVFFKNFDSERPFLEKLTRRQKAFYDFYKFGNINNFSPYISKITIEPLNFVAK